MKILFLITLIGSVISIFIIQDKVAEAIFWLSMILSLRFLYEK